MQDEGDENEIASAGGHAKVVRPAVAARLLAHEMRLDVRQSIRGRSLADTLEHLGLDVRRMHVTARPDDLRCRDREESRTAAEIGERRGLAQTELPKRAHWIEVCSTLFGDEHLAEIHREL